LKVSAGWSCAILLVPILVLAHNGPRLEELHSLSAALVLAQALAGSFQNPLLLVILGGASAALGAQITTIPIVTLVKSALSSATLQAALLVGLKGTFSLGEASILAQLIVMGKFLFSSAFADDWTIVQRLAYLVWIGTVLGTMLTSTLTNFIPALRSPLVLGASVAGALAGAMKLLNLDTFACYTALVDLLNEPGSSAVLLIWVAGLGATMTLSWIFCNSNIDKEEAGMLQIFRKSYHFVALVMFLPSGLCNVYKWPSYYHFKTASSSRLRNSASLWPSAHLFC